MPARKKIVRKGSTGSQLERDFEMLWKFYRGPDLVRELEFHPGRKWRADFAHPEARVLIEIEGGIYSRGRHTRGSGYAADCEKYNAAALDGWTVIRLAGKEMISREWVEKIIAAIDSRTQKAPPEGEA